MALPEPGFIFWGLFLVCGAVFVAYAAWMVRANARSVDPDADGSS